MPGDRILNSPKVESLAMLVFKLPDVRPQVVKAVDSYFANLKDILMLYIHDFGSLLVSSSYLPPIIHTTQLVPCLACRHFGACCIIPA
jgi:hypothetical protein